MVLIGTTIYAENGKIFFLYQVQYKNFEIIKTQNISQKESENVISDLPSWNTDQLSVMRFQYDPHFGWLI